MKFNLKTRYLFLILGQLSLLGVSGSSHALGFTGSCPTEHSMNMAHTGEVGNTSQKLADTECSSCHGEDGNGVREDDDVPYLAGQNFAYLCAWLDHCRTLGKDCENHEDIADQLSDRDIVGLAMFYSHQPFNKRMPK